MGTRDALLFVLGEGKGGEGGSTREEDIPYGLGPGRAAPVERGTTGAPRELAPSFHAAAAAAETTAKEAAKTTGHPRPRSRRTSRLGRRQRGRGTGGVTVRAVAQTRGGRARRVGRGG